MNRPVVVFRTTLMGYTPSQRVDAALARLRHHLAAGEPGGVSVGDLPQGRMVLVGIDVIFTLMDDDVDASRGETADRVANQAADVLRETLRDAAEQQSWQQFLTAGAQCVVATILLLLALLVLVRGHGLIYARMMRATAQRAEALTIGEFRHLSEGLIWLVHRGARLSFWLVTLYLFYAWSGYCLRRFPATRPFGNGMHEELASLAQHVLESVAAAIPGLIFVVMAVIVIYHLGHLVDLFFHAVERGRVQVPEPFRDTARSTHLIVTACLWLFCLVVSYPYLPGSQSEAFRGVTVFLGLLLSIGSSSLVNHLASGMIITYSRALKVDDYVQVGDKEGTILSLGVLSTRILTLKREEINIPNAVLVATSTTNYTRRAGVEGVILYTSVTIGYDTPWRQVHELLLMAADRTPGLRKSPRPFVWQTALNDFYVNYQLNAHLEHPAERLPVLAALHPNIQDMFNEFGVQICSPHYMYDPIEPKVVAPEHWYEAPAVVPRRTTVMPKVTRRGTTMMSTAAESGTGSESEKAE